MPFEQVPFYLSNSTWMTRKCGYEPVDAVLNENKSSGIELLPGSTTSATPRAATGAAWSAGGVVPGW